MVRSVWRRVRARVHLSLTPIELANPIRSATRKAFSSLLMRYNPELGGAVVAHIGPVELCGPPAFVDASPFAHVAAVVTLLVFAPTKGTELVGVVTHVGPDHLGLSVLSAFHAVLPIDGLSDIYRFESNYTSSAPTPMWNRVEGTDHVTVDRQIRFVISELKPTRTGLFQIIASLDPTFRQNARNPHRLGLLPPEQEIPLSTQSLQQGNDNFESQPADVLQVAKRTSAARANDSLRGDELLTAGNDTLGDMLMPTTTPVSALKQKKRRSIGTEPRSVSFEDSGRGIPPVHSQDKRPSLRLEQPLSKTVPSLAANSKGDIDQNGVNVSQTAETSDRKKRKKERKRKKKKKTSSRDTERSEGSARRDQESDPSEAGNKTTTREGDRADSGLQRATKQEQRTVDERNQTDEQETSAHDKEGSSGRCCTPTTNAETRMDTKEQESDGRRRSHKREGKKSKKKRRGKDLSRGREGNAPGATEENAGKRATMVAKEGEEIKRREKRKSERQSSVSNGENRLTSRRQEDGCDRETGDENGRATMVVKAEAKKNNEAGVDANREISMRRDAEKAVELGPMKGNGRTDETGTREAKVEDERGLVQTQAQVMDENSIARSSKDTKEKRKKKKKKKRRRSSEGEMDEQELKRRKKKKKRMSEGALAIERRRSLQG